MADGPVDVLRLVATSVAGRPLEVASAAAGTPAWTDGRTIYLDPSASRIDQLAALTVQASLLAAGSLAPHVLRRLARHPAVIPGYVAIEGARSLAANTAHLPVAVRGQLGSAAPVSRSVEDSLAAARRGGRPPAVFGTIRPREVLAALDADPDLSTDGQPSPRSAPQPGDANVDDEPGIDDGLDVLSDLSGAGGLLGRLLQRFTTGEKASGDGPLADAPTRGRVVAARPGTVGRGRAGAAPADADSVPSVDGWRYPEWDERRHAYRVDWCTVTEEEPSDVGAAAPVHTTTSLRRPLAQLGLARQPTRRQRQGLDLDVDAVVEAHVERLAGVEPHDAVYVESPRIKHELAVLLLLDVSGSADEPGVAGRTVHEHQREAAAVLAEAFHAFGNRVAVHGFYSQGRSAVRFVRVKRFADPLDGRAHARLGALTAGAYTRLGAAIRHGSAVLESDGAGSRRLLIVLSDGFAYDQGYQGRYGEADARRALAEARRRGIGCLCLSVGATTDLVALRRVFGTAAHAAVRRSDDLGRMIGPLVRDALASAELQRRRTWRIERRAA